jgi:AraC family transcriptional regulator
MENRIATEWPEGDVSCTMSETALQNACLFTAQGRQHHAFAEAPLLSVKCMFNGAAVYRAGRAWFRVYEGGYLILNDRQPYEIHIDSPTRVESFVVYFPRPWSQQVLRCLTAKTEQLLDDFIAVSNGSVHFFERFMPHDAIVSPAVAALRRLHKSGPLSDLVVEQQLLGLLERMLRAQQSGLREAERLPALRRATREELWRRVNRAADYIRAHFASALTLQELAGVASLSRFHFLRAFKDVFGTTPHELVTQCRVDQARFLLERTELPVTQICFDVGFESLGTFSSWFRRCTGMAPREWRTNSQH